MEQESFQELLRSPVVQLAAPFVTGLIGFIVGNRLAIGRDRRNEYNAVADPLRHKLIKMRGAQRPCIGYIDGADWDLLLRVASPVQAKRLGAAMKRAKDAEQEDARPNELNEDLFTNVSAMEAHREQLIALLPRR